MTLAGPDTRILQIHPTRFCNLRCNHCYSSSGPEERGELGAPLLKPAIRDAVALGYNALTVSGGEPLLYAGLHAVCTEAHARGMKVTLATNGTRLTPQRLVRLAGLVDMIAISIDGVPERHNRIRRAPGAFEIMEQKLPLLQRSRIPFGFVFTLMRENLSELEWAADFAASHGAAILQIHPLETSGRASRHLAGQALPQAHMATAWMIAECLREIHREKLAIHFDSLNWYALPIEPTDVGEWKEGLLRGERALGEIVSPLVIETDGTVVPLRYGFARSLAFGNLRQFGLQEMVDQWVRFRVSSFCHVYRTVLEEVRASDQSFANVCELLSAEALRELTSIASVSNAMPQ
jgi:MoaA/NifB/PqqE/SkfB family radical SAM enzyme